jgi:hypothetical protein
MKYIARNLELTVALQFASLCDLLNWEDVVTQIRNEAYYEPRETNSIAWDITPVVRWILTNISDEHVASIFRVEE